MRPVDLLLAFAVPYVLAWLVSAVIKRLRVMPTEMAPSAVAQNALGRLTGAQRWSLVAYSVPELVFSIAALAIAVIWRPTTGLDGSVLRWGLAGMALVRLGLSWPIWRDLAGGQVLSLAGPLRKIQFRERRALATEDGPIVVLPVDQALFAAHEAGIPATIYYAPHSKRVVGVLPGIAAA